MQPFFDGFSRIKFSRISQTMYVLSVFADLIFADFADETLSNRLFLYFKRLFLQISVLFEIN